MSENLIKVYFDGGCGRHLYGSWEVVLEDGTRVRTIREHYPDQPRTCNVAEYRSLISALTYLQAIPNKHQLEVEIWGDSQLVVNQVRRGGWKTGKAHIGILRDRCRVLLSEFKDWSVHWHRRNNNVIRFGH